MNRAPSTTDPMLATSPAETPAMRPFLAAARCSSSVRCCSGTGVDTNRIGGQAASSAMSK